MNHGTQNIICIIGAGILSFMLYSAFVPASLSTAIMELLVFLARIRGWEELQDWVLQALPVITFIFMWYSLSCWLRSALKRSLTKRFYNLWKVDVDADSIVVFYVFKGIRISPKSIILGFDVFQILAWEIKGGIFTRVNCEQKYDLAFQNESFNEHSYNKALIIYAQEGKTELLEISLPNDFDWRATEGMDAILWKNTRPNKVKLYSWRRVLSNFRGGYCKSRDISRLEQDIKAALGDNPKQTILSMGGQLADGRKRKGKR